jgi:hypothetical protein
VDVRITGSTVANLDAVLSARYGNDKPKEALLNPSVPAVGEIWVDTQYEKTSGKNKPGTASAVNGQTWQVRRKVALPNINMNNPHNMWTDKNQNLIYQTQWFDSKLAVFNRGRRGESERERFDRSDRQDRSGHGDRPDRIERPDKFDRSERPDHSGSGRDR